MSKKHGVFPGVVEMSLRLQRFADAIADAQVAADLAEFREAPIPTGAGVAIETADVATGCGLVVVEVVGTARATGLAEAAAAPAASACAAATEGLPSETIADARAEAGLAELWEAAATELAATEAATSAPSALALAASAPSAADPGVSEFLTTAVITEGIPSPEYRSEYIELMRRAVAHFGITATPPWPKEQEIEAFFLAATLPNGEHVSKRLAESMTTICRPFAAQTKRRRP
jgi:hypothetical protein